MTSSNSSSNFVVVVVVAVLSLNATEKEHRIQGCIISRPKLLPLKPPRPSNIVRRRRSYAEVLLHSLWKTTSPPLCWIMKHPKRQRYQHILSSYRSIIPNLFIPVWNVLLFPSSQLPSSQLLLRLILVVTAFIVLLQDQQCTAFQSPITLPRLSMLPKNMKRTTTTTATNHRSTSLPTTTTTLSYSLQLLPHPWKEYRNNELLLTRRISSHPRMSSDPMTATTCMAKTILSPPHMLLTLTPTDNTHSHYYQRKQSFPSLQQQYYYSDRYYKIISSTGGNSCSRSGSSTKSIIMGNHHRRQRGILGFQIHSNDETTGTVSSSASALSSTMQEHPRATDVSDSHLDNRKNYNNNDNDSNIDGWTDYQFPSNYYPIDTTSTTGSSSTPPSTSHTIFPTNSPTSLWNNHHYHSENTRLQKANLISNVDSMAWNLPEPLIGTSSSSSSLSSSSVASLEDDGTTTTTTTTSTSIVVPWIPSENDIDQLTVVQLKSELGLRALKKVGNKYLLQNRFKEWIQQSSSTTTTSTTKQPSSTNTMTRRRDQSTTKTSSSSSTKVTSFLENELPTWDIDSSTFLRTNDRRSHDEEVSITNDTRTEEPLLLNVDSLQEWARTVDLEPLLHRREAIHRDKLMAPPKQSSSSSSSPHHRTSLHPELPSDLRKVIQKMFDQPSSIYSNWEVKQMYAAAKHADQIGDRVLSKRILYELKTATPNDARIYRRIARMEQEENHVAVARAVLQEGIMLHPENAYLWHGLGQLEGSLGNVTAQRWHWEKAIEVDPYVPNSYHALGILDHTNGRIANAMKVLKKGIHYCPTNHRLHHALGDIYRDAKMLPLARMSYQKAIQYGPLVSHGFAYTALSYVAYEEGSIDQCRHYLRKAVHLNNGRHANGWVALAQMEESEGNIDAARTACMVGIGQYERGLIEQSRRTIQQQSMSNKVDSPIRSDHRTLLSLSENPVTLRKKILQTIPTYRSGDRFFNVYRNWLRLEERYGTIDTFEEVYERAIVAFPNEYKIMIDAAQYFVRLNLFTKARDAFTKACSFHINHPNINVDPYRLFAEFEMQLGNYAEAQNILYSGAMILSKYSSSAFATSRRGLPHLFLKWAICEWHLNNPTHTEKLFEYALRLTSRDVEETPKLRSMILYAMSRFEYDRKELRRAQHYIGLCLRENALPGGNNQVWDLWATVAYEMGNIKLAHQCQEQSSFVRSNGDGVNESNDIIPSLSDTLKSSTMYDRPDMYQLMRRDPWHTKIFRGTNMNDNNNFLSEALFPHSSDNKIASVQYR